MIIALSLTLIIEGIVVCGFALWRKKPLGLILPASVIGNILTQSMLWGMLKLFPQAYLTILFSMELFIWLFESAVLRYFPLSPLNWREALFLSFGMNMFSFGIGWFLPV